MPYSCLRLRHLKNRPGPEVVVEFAGDPGPSAMVIELQVLDILALDLMNGNYFDHTRCLLSTSNRHGPRIWVQGVAIALTSCVGASV